MRQYVSIAILAIVIIMLVVCSKVEQPREPLQAIPNGNLEAEARAILKRKNMIASAANLLEEPSSLSGWVQAVGRGIPVTVDAFKLDGDSGISSIEEVWFHVQIGNGVSGWLRGKVLSPLDQETVAAYELRALNRNRSGRPLTEADRAAQYTDVTGLQFYPDRIIAYNRHLLEEIGSNNYRSPFERFGQPDELQKRDVTSQYYDEPNILFTLVYTDKELHVLYVPQLNRYLYSMVLLKKPTGIPLWGLDIGTDSSYITALLGKPEKSNSAEIIYFDFDGYIALTFRHADAKVVQIQWDIGMP